MPLMRRHIRIKTIGERTGVTRSDHSGKPSGNCDEGRPHDERKGAEDEQIA